VSISHEPVIATESGGETRTATAAPSPRASVTTPHAIVTTRMPVPIRTPLASVSRRISRPIRARIHIALIAATARTVERSSGLTNPVKRNPAIAVTATPAT